MRRILLLAILTMLAFAGAMAQGVTTATVTGVVKDKNGQGLPGANVVATHVPSGTTYGSVSLTDGKFTIPAMRIGGPYTIKVSFVGYQEASYSDIYLSLGTSANLEVVLSESSETLEEVVVSANKSDVFSSERTGAATNITKEAITGLPTLSRSINDFTRLTPQASGRSFVGQDARFNNITIDGSLYNNSFGLADQPGGRTGSAPISLDAIEEIQVNIAPFDVRQAGFIGAGVNAVTRSGTNDFSGSVFFNTRSEKLVGTKAGDLNVTTNDFSVKQMGFRLGGPIIKNKLFFFVNAESERRTDPGTPYTANSGSETVTGTKTRVLRTDLEDLSSYLATNFNYQTGPFEGYNLDTYSDKYLVKLDYNISQNHKLSVRYNYLKSETENLISNSSSLGFGNRRTNSNAMSYANSNYGQGEVIKSIIAELNSTLGSKIANNFIIGYTDQNEDRVPKGQWFPLVEIQDNSSTYISFGFEPFTPFNQLSYKTFQVQDNVTIFAGKHTITTGFNLERLSFKNVFFPGSQSVYVYSSLADFYTDADDYLANGPTRTTSVVDLRRFQLRYTNPDVVSGFEPVQPTKVTYFGLYAQDEFSPKEGLKITAGLRMDIPIFDETGYLNTDVLSQTYVDENGDPYKINTAKLPDAKPLFSPRLGFNWDVKGDRTTQVRGGTGIFTGRPVFVWISNQIGNNGVLTGFDQFDNVASGTTTANGGRPFSPDPTEYIPAVASLPSSYEIAATDPGFKFPQVWRTNLAIDQRLPWAGLIGTLELILSKDVNGIGYFNANLPAPSTSFTGADTRNRYTSTRINPSTVNAIVLSNGNKGSSKSISLKLEKPFTNGLTAMAAYNFGVAKNMIDPGSIASGSYNNNPIVNNPNNPGASYANNDQRHRAIAMVSYRKEWSKFAATQVSMFWEGRNQGRASYIYSTDANGDGNRNDLIYIPKSTAEMNFKDYDPDGAGPAPTYTAAQQAADFEAFIKQDKYLNDHRGEYAERNGVIFPWVFQADFNIIQEIFFETGSGKRNTLQIRFDIINVGNMINKNWGVGNVINTTRPVRYQGLDVDGTSPAYRLNASVVNGNIVPVTKTFGKGNSIGDVWQAQFGIRYIFN